MTTTRPATTGSCLVAACLFVLAGCELAKTKQAEPPVPERWVAVRTAEAGPGLEVPARVLGGPAARAVVTAPLRASVVRVRVQAGDVVLQGAPLVDVLMPEVLQAAGRAEGARVRLAAWQERHQQLAGLRADGLVRSLDVSEATARIAEARAELQAARAVLVAAGLRESDAGGLLAGTGVSSLRAPIAGVVTQVNVVLGESREPGSGALVELAGAGAVRVEARFARAPPDAGFVFVVGSRELPVRLLSRSPLADPKDGTTEAWFEPVDEAPAAGLLGRLRQVGGRQAGFHVPSLALLRVDGQAQVQTRKGVVPVTVERCALEDCVVLGALTADDLVRVEAAR